MRLVDLAHDYLNAQLQRGDRALDATAGNGYDSECMATRVGPAGHVIAIDIQNTAISATRARLEAANCINQTELIVADHAQALQSLCEQYTQTISAITFNLGYLPGSDKSIQTEPESTVVALRAASELLKQNGLLLVTAYRGHDGGQAEASIVANWMQTIKSRGWSVDSHEPVVTSGRIPPILWVARKI
ncbi:MAG: 16S rRNA C1402 N4-methylase RsmH [Lentimonas sp.]|jgi:predicted methyltransferase